MRVADVQKDDFETAFAEFSAPDDKKPDQPSANAEPAGEEGKGAADGGGDGAQDGAAVDTDGAAAAGDDGVAASADGGDPAKAEGEAEAAAGAAEPAKGEGDAASAEPAKAEPAAAVAEPDASADAILAGLKKLVGDTKPAAAEPPAAKEEAPQEEKPIYTDEEKEFLGEYDKEWGDVVRGEALKRRGEYKDLLGYVFQQIHAYIEPIKEMAEAASAHVHRQSIETNIADYSDNLRDDVVAWAATQPAYLQAAYNHVITQGTVEEVKDLVDRYRAATGRKPAGAGTQPSAGKKDNELSDEAKKAAASLAPVDVKRSGVQQPGDPANFDDAWKQFSTDQT